MYVLSICPVLSCLILRMKMYKALLSLRLLTKPDVRITRSNGKILMHNSANKNFLVKMQNRKKNVDLQN